MCSAPWSSECRPASAVSLYHLETELRRFSLLYHSKMWFAAHIKSSTLWCTCFYNNRNKFTFSTSSAYADRPGFSALNVSWVNLGVSVQKQYSKISISANHFAYTKPKPFLQITSLCANGSQLEPLSNEQSKATQPLNIAPPMELALPKTIW